MYNMGLCDGLFTGTFVFGIVASSRGFHLLRISFFIETLWRITYRNIEKGDRDKGL